MSRGNTEQHDRDSGRVSSPGASSRSVADRIKAAALELGFDAAGISDLARIERDALRAWLESGYAGTMRYMHRQARRREEPSLVVRGAARAVVVLKSYFQEETGRSAARVARYAWGEDYHRVLGQQLAELAEFLVSLGSSPALTRCYVDAGPIPERELAERAGLGWIAKNTMLIHPRLGSFTFIGTVFTDLELPTDAPFPADQCGTCRLCLDACPTSAFAAERVLDSRRCISYLTIEHRGPFADAEGASIGDWLFGCDVCQDVCPWNTKFASATAEPRFAARPEIARADLASLAGGNVAEFAERYADTAFARPGVAGMARNAAQVLKNGARPQNPPARGSRA